MIGILNILNQPLTPGMTTGIVVVFILILGSALIGGSELAFFTLSPADRLALENKRSRKGKTLLQLLSNPEKLMASLLVANVVLKMIILVISLMIANAINLLPFWSMLASVMAIAFLLIFFGEIVAKLYASAHPKKYMIAAAYPIYILHHLFIPISALFFRSANAFEKTFFHRSKISVNNLSNAIELASDTHTEEEDILKGIVKFGNIYVRDILKPRIDVIAIDFRMTLKQVLAIVVESGYSRIPVYSENFDNIRGILYVKDLLPFIHEKDTFRWQSLIRPPYFVPETKKVKELLTEFQGNKIHMAVIVDEYGGTLGIVTLEDILEEIVGEITDESDEDEKKYTQINENTYIFDGKTLLNDFYKIIQSEQDIFDEIKGDADTLAGLILELKGAIPALNEQINYKQFTFKIEGVDARRIKQIRVIIKQDQNK